MASIKRSSSEERNLIFKLNPIYKKNIIECLDKFTILFENKLVDDNININKEKNQFINDCEKLINSLIDIFSKPQKINYTDSSRSQLFFLIDHETLTKIVRLLNENKICANVKSDNLVEPEKKNELIRSNREIFNYLVSLGDEFISENITENVNYHQNINTKDFNNIEKILDSKFTEIYKKFSNINNQLKNDNEKLQTTIKEIQLSNKSTNNKLDQLKNDNVKLQTTIKEIQLLNESTNEKLNQLKNDNEKLQNTIKEMQLLNESTNKSTVFNWEFNNMNEFFKSNTKRSSNVFYCGSIPWSIWIYCQIKETENKYYLGVHLKCEDNKFSKIKTSLSFRLLNYLNQRPIFAKRQLYHIYLKSEGFGDSYFYNWQELSNLENGYMFNDAITIQVALKIENITEFSFPKIKQENVNLVD